MNIPDPYEPYLHNEEQPRVGGVVGGGANGEQIGGEIRRPTKSENCRSINLEPLNGIRHVTRSWSRTVVGWTEGG
jgi:hypothetical protein